MPVSNIFRKGARKSALELACYLCKILEAMAVKSLSINVPGQI